MNGYAIAKVVHVTCVALSIAGFIARFVLVSRGSALAHHRPARIAPHVNDSVLLGAAIAMLWVARVNPFAVPWLSAKIAGLLVYIALGAVALRHGETPTGRRVAFAAALLSFVYVVSVALAKHPLGALAWLAS